MSKFVVIVFPNETVAYQGTRALKGLHAEGSLTVYGMAVIARDDTGSFVVREAVDASPMSTAVGAVVGGLVGVFGGPVGVLAGAAGGGLIGGLIDLFNYGIGEDFIVKVSDSMVEPGKTAIVAEIAEIWTIPLDTRMESLGGVVLRTWRADFEDEQIAKEVAATRADLDQLRAEYKQATLETKEKVMAKIGEAKAKLEQAENRLKAKLDRLEKDAKAKVAALEKQVGDAKVEAKDKIRQRIATARTDLETRSAKLKQAWVLTKEALAA